MSKSVIDIGIGVALIAADVALPGIGGAASSFLLSAGAGFVMQGVGTLIGQKGTGIHTTTRNPLAPWQVIYGRKKVGGTIFYQEEVGSNNRILLLGVVVACHPCDAIEEVWFDNRKLQMQYDPSNSDKQNPAGFLESFDPPQGIWQIETISRTNDVVSVTFAQDPDSLYSSYNGETIWIRDTLDSAGGDSMNGYFPMTQTGDASFTYTSGGVQGPGANATGTMKSTWPQYGANVTVGYYLGNGEPGDSSGIFDGNSNGFWNTSMSGDGLCWVALKLTWDDRYFTGLPEISFVVRGKNDIYDPRTGLNGYTNNAALVIADYLAQPVWGFNAQYGTQIPLDQLVAAANLCDEQVPLAVGQPEARYMCDGSFDVSVKRGEVIQNLLTSCAGRLIYYGGQFFIQPAGWVEPAGSITIGDGSTGPLMLMNQLGLVVDRYNNPALGRTEYFPDSCGSTADQFLFALGMLQAYQATGNGNALALAQKAMVPLEAVLYRGNPVPPQVTTQSIWAPDWVYNVKEPFLSADIRYQDTFLFSNGVGVVPDTNGEVRKIFQVLDPGYTLEFVSPFSPPATGATYPIASAAYVTGVGTEITLTDQTLNGEFAVIYSCLDGDVVQDNEPFTALPDWAKLATGQIDTSCDFFNWAMRLFGLASIVIDGSTPSAPNLGYGMNPYGVAPYGDPVTPPSTAASSNELLLTATQQMAAIAYQVAGIPIVLNRGSGAPSILVYGAGTYSGGAIPYLVNFLGSPAWLAGWTGPYPSGHQSPWAVKQLGNEANVALAVQFLADAQAAFQANAHTADTVRVVITGPNAQTFDVPIGVDASGDATAAFSYAGTAPGTDSIQAFLDSKSLSSNIGEIEWSPFTVPIGVFGVKIQVMQADGSSLFNALGPVLNSQNVSGLMFNSHPQSIFPGDPHQSGNQANPFVCNNVDTSGNYAGDTPIGSTSGPFNAVITGVLTIETAGDISFTAYLNAAFVIGVAGATYVSGTQNFGALSGGTALKGYPALAGLNTAGDWPGGNYAVITFTLHFAAPGLYPFEIDFTSGPFSEREFALLGNGGVIPSVNLASASGSSATGASGSGSMILTPYSGGDFIGQSQAFSVALSGLSYPAVSGGPFAPAYYFPQPTGRPTWGPDNTFGWNGPDPEITAGRFQYRPLAELADLIAACTGTEAYYSSAVTVTNSFLAWIDAVWTTAADGPPNLFPQAGAQTTVVDPHLAALILHAALVMDMVARPSGGGTMNSTLSSLLTKVYTLFGDLYLSSGPMQGTFCVNPVGAQDWHGHWHGEILRSLSILVQWSTINSDATKKAQAIVWIDGMVDFALNSVVEIDPDLGFGVSDLAGQIIWKPKLQRADLYNGIKGSYISEANQWQQSDFPSYAQDTLHGYTGGDPAFNNDLNWEADGARLWKDVQLPFTTSVAAAQRIAKIEFMRIRQQGRGSVIAKMQAYKQAPLDIVYLSFSPFGWTNKVVEIANLRFTLKKVTQGDKDVMMLGTEMDIQETDPSVYDWDVSEELSAQGYSYIAGLANVAPD